MDWLMYMYAGGVVGVCSQHLYLCLFGVAIIIDLFSLYLCLSVVLSCSILLSMLLLSYMPVSRPQQQARAHM
jgi:hypothetical protein